MLRKPPAKLGPHQRLDRTVDRRDRIALLLVLELDLLGGHTGGKTVPQRRGGERHDRCRRVLERRQFEVTVPSAIH